MERQNAEALEAVGLSVTVADARFAKPLDTDLLAELSETHDAIITIEQGATGGFGALVLHHLANSGALDHGLKVRTMTLPDRFIDQASPARMYGILVNLHPSTIVSPPNDHTAV